MTANLKVFRPAMFGALTLGVALLGSAPRYAGAEVPANHLSGSELQAQLAGRTITGTNSKGDHWQENLRLDGTVLGYWLNGPVYRAKWRIVGDTMCFDYQGTEDDHCFYVVIEDGDLFFYYEDGTIYSDIPATLVD